MGSRNPRDTECLKKQGRSRVSRGDDKKQDRVREWLRWFEAENPGEAVSLTDVPAQKRLATRRRSKR